MIESLSVNNGLPGIICDSTANYQQSLTSEYTGNVVAFSGVGYHNSFILWCGLACSYTLSRKKRN